MILFFFIGLLVLLYPSISNYYNEKSQSKAIVDYVCNQQKAHYDETLLMSDDEKGATTMVESKDDYDEPLYNEIVDFVVSQGKASASLLQRRFRLGYNRAARCIDLFLMLPLKLYPNSTWCVQNRRSLTPE